LIDFDLGDVCHVGKGGALWPCAMGKGNAYPTMTASRVVFPADFLRRSRDDVDRT